MAVNPEAQRKGQDEIDNVIGTSRLPKITDRPALPYIEALMKEVLRWHPVVPLSTCLSLYPVTFPCNTFPGPPHVLNEAQIVDGYTFPKGTTLLGNIWYAR
jgi:cytochrome P450